MNKTQEPDISEQSSTRGKKVEFNPAIFRNTLIGYPVFPEGEVEFTAVTDLLRKKPLYQFAELFAPLEDLKLRTPLAGHLAPALNRFYVWDHIRKATMYLQTDLERIRNDRSKDQWPNCNSSSHNRRGRISNVVR